MSPGGRRLARFIIDAVAVAALVALAANAPFQYCPQPARCAACAVDWLFTPPLWLDTKLLCRVHWEQLLLRAGAVAAGWFAARRLILLFS